MSDELGRCSDHVITYSAIVRLHRQSLNCIIHAVLQEPRIVYEQIFWVQRPLSRSPSSHNVFWFDLCDRQSLFIRSFRVVRDLAVVMIHLIYAMTHWTRHDFGRLKSTTVKCEKKNNNIITTIMLLPSTCTYYTRILLQFTFR